MGSRSTTTPATKSATRPGRSVARSHRRPTLTDVAALAGVHRTTVSAVLNDRPNCYASAQTKQRIHDAAAQLDYRPSTLARGLNGKSTATLGLVITGLDTEPSSRKFIGFELAARQADRVTIITCTSNDPASEDQAIRWLTDRRVDGLAIYPTEHGEHHELRRLIAQGFPVVTFDGAHRPDALDCDDVSVDSEAAGRLLGEHLIASGRQNIAEVVLVPRCHVNDLKSQGLKRALVDAGLPPAKSLTLNEGAFPRYRMGTEGFEQLRPLLKAHGESIDALACPGDLIALAAIRIATEIGLRVPEDLAVMGIDGLAASNEGARPLSTVWHDAEAIGRMAFEMLDERIAGKRKASDPRRSTVTPETQVRAST